MGSIGFFTVVLCLFYPMLAASQVNVLTHHNDIGRTGQNLQEVVLNTSNVNARSFGKLFARTVDGQVHAQPLYLSHLQIQGTMHNVVFVATMHNSVYAFDADDPKADAPLWQVNLGPPASSQDACQASGCDDIQPEIGIMSTPVIDAANGTIYVVARTKRSSDSTCHFTLSALDVLSGAEK
jgi:outer membrane protein assembly factor BamB